MYKVAISILIISIVTLSLLPTHLYANASESRRHDIYNDELSQGQRNIVKRARQMTEIEWTPLQGIQSWNENPDFVAGNTYRGIPYGRPWQHVPVDFSFEHFINAVNNINSRMYTSNATRDHIAPFYSTDCSAFLSYAWGIPRHWTFELPNVADDIGTNLQDIQVGDALNRPHFHVLLITDIVRNSNGIIVAIETAEAFSQISRRTWFGEGHSRSLNQINSRYLNNEFNIIRFRERDYVTYSHTCLIPIVYCRFCNPYNAMSRATRNASSRCRTAGHNRNIKPTLSPY